MMITMYRNLFDSPTGRKLYDALSAGDVELSALPAETIADMNECVDDEYDTLEELAKAWLEVADTFYAADSWTRDELMTELAGEDGNIDLDDPYFEAVNSMLIKTGREPLFVGETSNPWHFLHGNEEYVREAWQEFIAEA